MKTVKEALALNLKTEERASMADFMILANKSFLAVEILQAEVLRLSKLAGELL